MCGCKHLIVSALVQVLQSDGVSVAHPESGSCCKGCGKGPSRWRCLASMLKHAAYDLAQQPGQRLPGLAEQAGQAAPGLAMREGGTVLCHSLEGQQACTAQGELGPPAAGLAAPGLSFGYLSLKHSH